MLISFVPADGRKGMEIPLDGVRYIFDTQPSGELACDVPDAGHAKRIKVLLGLEDEEPKKK